MTPPRPYNQTVRWLLALAGVFAWLFLVVPPGNAQPLTPLRVAICFEEPIKGLALAELDPKSAPTGYIPELAEALARHLDRPLRIVSYSQVELYTSLERGEADIAIYPGEPPPGLKPHLALSRPWARSCQGVLSRRGVPPGGIGAFFPKVTGATRSVQSHGMPDLDLIFLLPAGNPWGPLIAEDFPGVPQQDVPDLEVGLATVLKSRPATSGIPRSFPVLDPSLVIPLRQALLLHRAHPDSTSVLGYLPQTQESWQFALSATLAKESMDAVDQFIQEYAKRPDGFTALNQKHLVWELKSLERLGLPAYTDVAEAEVDGR